MRSWQVNARLAAARRAAQVIASQGDTLMFGGVHKFGHGAKQEAAHAAAARCTTPDCTCKGTGCTARGCYCHGSGEPGYSAGEVFNQLARGLAAAAYQPGGITYAGMHWCTAACCLCHDTGIVYVEAGCAGCCDLPGFPHLPECGTEPCPDGCPVPGPEDEWDSEPEPPLRFRRTEDVIDQKGRL
jgi:hypothetical protein